MKLQGVSVLFALIVLPLILVLSYYIRLQVQTIRDQNQYDAKLLNSTRDALSAFEINTANEDLSTVSDSLRTIIEASSNVFINTLATNLGMSNASKSYIEPYVPALLYTLYDGYYIYAPTRVPTVLTDADGNAVSVGDAGVSVSGDNYNYRIAHATEKSEKECQVCAGTSSPHIKFDQYSNPDNYLEYTDLTVNQENDYGQILYETVNDGVYTTDVNKARLKTKNVLKSYMPYSARYKGTDYDISVVYTLDNYLTIEGNVKEIYYTKSGYLLPINCYDNTVGNIEELKKYSQEDAKKKIETGEPLSLTLSDGNVIESGGSGSYADISEQIISLNTRMDNAHYYLIAIAVSAMPEGSNEIKTFIESTGKTYNAANVVLLLDEIMRESREEINRLQYELDKMSAMVYYVNGIIFTDWIQKTLCGGTALGAVNVIEKDLVEISGQEYRTVNGNELLAHKFDSDESIFKITGFTEKGVTDIPEDSVFYTHKLNVIRNSIQYNLNLAMSTYNNMTTGQSSYAMPVMENEEWQKILTNPSIVSFLQGYHCGLKTYNNYMIVSSTNSEIAVSLDDIYYVDKGNFSNETTEYHKIDCPKLASATNEYIAFTSKDAKYDKVYDKHNSLLSYKYDHKNYACYDCINDGNYVVNEIFKKQFGDYEKLDRYGNKVTVDVSTEEQAKARTLVKAYYIGVGKCKNNLYKMNAVEKPEGYEIVYNTDPSVTPGVKTSSLPLKYIKAVEIVFGTIRTTNPQETVLQYKVGISDKGLLAPEIYSFASNVTTDNTILVRFDPNLPATLEENTYVEGDTLNLVFHNQAATTTVYYDSSTGRVMDPDAVFKNSIKYIRVIYK